MMEIRADFACPVGQFRPQHGMNNIPGTTARPFCGNGLTANQFNGATDTREAERVQALLETVGLPVIRLSGPGVPGWGKAMEVPYIFRDFRKDADDPASYYFYATDPYVRAAAEWKESRLVYRLGAPREYWAPRYNKKPADYEQFAQICLNIVRHLNDGWADGLHAGIGTWEIWERADDRQNWPEGTWEDYYRLYDTVARKLKAYNPALRVGGPAAADCSGDAPFLAGFLRYVKAHGTPCDFVSWHFYGEEPDEAIRQAHTVKRLVDEAGLPGVAEIANDGWNCMTIGADGRFCVPNVRNMTGAAFAAAFLIGMQQAGMDWSAYYQCGRNLPWTGLYHVRPIRPNKPLYAMAAYAQLYALGTEVRTQTAGAGLYAAAGADGNRRLLLASVCRPGENEVRIATGTSGQKRVRILDAWHDLECLLETSEPSFRVETQGETVILVEEAV